MPTEVHEEGKRPYARWGKHGAKYFFRRGDDGSRAQAVKRANLQGRAIETRERYGLPKKYGSRSYRRAKRRAEKIKNIRATNRIAWEVGRKDAVAKSKPRELAHTDVVRQLTFAQRRGG